MPNRPEQSRNADPPMVMPLYSPCQVRFSSIFLKYQFRAALREIGGDLSRRQRTNQEDVFQNSACKWRGQMGWEFLLAGEPATPRVGLQLHGNPSKHPSSITFNTIATNTTLIESARDGYGWRSLEEAWVV